MDFVYVLKELYWLARKHPEDVPSAVLSLLRSFGRPVVSLGGVLLRISPRLSLEVIRAIENGSYERPERRMVQATLSPDDRVLEFGSGLGFMSAFCARTIGSDRVFTFEGNPALKLPIEETFRLNAVSPVFENCLIGRSSGSAQFHVAKSFLASSAYPIPGSKSVVVPVRSFREEVLRIQPSFLIVDIEGGEVEIFDDAVKSMPSVRKIAIEVHPWITGEEALSRMEQDLHAAGFSLVAALSVPGRQLYLERR